MFNYRNCRDNSATVVLLLHCPPGFLMMQKVYIDDDSCHKLCFITRFDLIFLMLDPEDELFDRKLANHLVSLYYKSTEQEQQEMLVSIRAGLNTQ